MQPRTAQTFPIFIYIIFIEYVCSKAMDLKNLVFFSEIDRAGTGAMWQLVGKRVLWKPHQTHYSLQYGDKGGIQKVLISVKKFQAELAVQW